MAQLTAEQEELVNDLQERVKDIDRPECSSKSFLVRWLRARTWDVADAEKLLRCHIKWRIENEVDSILTWFKVPEVIEKYFPGGICGKDKQGRPLFVTPVGCLDPKSFLKCISRTEFLQSRVYELERIVHVVFPEASARAGRPIEQLSVIMDMQGLGLKHMSPSLLAIISESVTVLESNYPEVLGTCFVVNAPPIFSRLYAFVKPLLSRETQEKVQILDANYQETLLQYFDPQDLPMIYGGTLVDENGDPRCSALISWAGVVPDHYYSSSKDAQNNGTQINGDNRRHASGGTGNTSPDQSPLLMNKQSFTVVEVGRGSRRDVPLGWLSTGTEITYSVICEAHDIDVGLCMYPCAHRDSQPNGESRFGFRTSPSTPNLGQRQPTQSSSPAKTPSPTLVGRDPTAPTVLELQRITARESPFRSRHTAQTAGQYYLRLDNSYSWMRVKRVRYAVTVHDSSALSLTGRSRSSSQLHSPESASLTEPVASLNNTVCSTPPTGANQPPRSGTDSNSSSCSDLSIFPIPEDTKHRSLLVTGGSMDVNISLLFRLLARVLLVPKDSPVRHYHG